MRKISVLGFPVHLITKPEALAHTQQLILSKPGHSCQVVTLNPEMIMAGMANSPFGDVLKTADLILPDGAGLVWSVRRAGYVVTRLPGIEFSESLLAWAAAEGIRVALVGASPDVLDGAVNNLRRRYAGLNLVYQHHGFFKAEQEADIAAECAATSPQIVLVALGVPRQELWIKQYRDAFPNAVLIGVGGSLDVWSGLKKRAPAWMRALNLEWAYRIGTEPWRLKRTYNTLPLFVVKIISNRHAVQAEQ